MAGMSTKVSNRASMLSVEGASSAVESVVAMISLGARSRVSCLNIMDYGCIVNDDFIASTMVRNVRINDL